MKLLSRFLPSFLITILMSFLAPVVVCGLVLTLCSTLWVLPGMSSVFMQGALTEFLEVFGSGNAWQGVLVIAAACSLVGGMFEAFNLCYYQNTN